MFPPSHPTNRRGDQDLSIKSVSKLTNPAGDAYILRTGEPSIQGLYARGPETGDVTVEFDEVPQGLLVLVLDDGLDSRYPGTIQDGELSPFQWPGFQELP